MPSKMPLDTLLGCRSSQTPPSSPSEPHLCQCHLEPPVALHLVQLFKEKITITVGSTRCAHGWTYGRRPPSWRRLRLEFDDDCLFFFRLQAI